jgi:sterol 3beta-glucosyltransferase
MPRPGSSSSSDTPQDDQTAKPLQFHDPGLARLFSDAAHFGRILTSRADLVEDGFAAEDSRTVHDSLNGFSQLVACDLDDNERAVSERLAQLSVSTWARGGSTTLAPRVDPDESDDSASDYEHERTSPSGASDAPGEPNIEDKLTPDEILDLLQQEFGALAPPGEEKLILETDATLLQEVVILVCLSSEMERVLVLTTKRRGCCTLPHIVSHSTRRSRHHNPISMRES